MKHLPRANQEVVDFIAKFLRYPTKERMTAREVILILVLNVQHFIFLTIYNIFFNCLGITVFPFPIKWFFKNSY